MYHQTRDLARVLYMTTMIADKYLEKTFCFLQNVDIVDDNVHVGFAWRKEDDDLTLYYYVTEIMNGKPIEIITEDVFIYNIKERKGEKLHIQFAYDLFKMLKYPSEKDRKESFETNMNENEEKERRIDEKHDGRIMSDIIEKHVKSITKLIINNLH